MQSHEQKLPALADSLRVESAFHNENSLERLRSVAGRVIFVTGDGRLLKLSPVINLTFSNIYVTIAKVWLSKLSKRAE